MQARYQAALRPAGLTEPGFNRFIDLLSRQFTHWMQDILKPPHSSVHNRHYRALLTLKPQVLDDE